MKKIVFLLLIAFIIFGWFWVPGLQRGASILGRAHLVNARICRCQPQKNLTLERQDGLSIAASFYGLKPDENRPGILLIHGNTHHGRNLSFYRVLATRLADLGYTVLSIDLTGYGQSSDPFTVNQSPLSSMTQDVDAAFQFLKNTEGVDATQSFIVGHSRGSIPTLNVGTQREDVSAIALIGPTRRAIERLQIEEFHTALYERDRTNYQQSTQKDYPAWYNKNVWLADMIRQDILTHIPTLQKSDHVPILFIDGELETKEDRAFLQRVYDGIEEPKEYVTIPNSDHYGNTIQLLSFVIYDRVVIDETVSAIHDFFARF